MSFVMNDKCFVSTLIDIATNYKTLYVKGCFGAPMTAKNKTRYTNNNDYNRSDNRSKMINTASEDTFGFDCVCLIKGVLWGWSGNISATYGGAKYKANKVADDGTERIIERCADVSTDFSNIVPGELLHKEGHVGVYIGNGLAVECTPAWKNGVQITAVANIGNVPGYSSRKWTDHGKLPYIEYQEATKADDVTPVKIVEVEVGVVKRGVKSEFVKTAQALLNMRMNAGLEIDGSCGQATENAIKAFQEANKLSVDGSCGAATWTKLIGN